MEQNTEERKEAIHPIHGWWISQGKIDTIKGNIRDKILTDLKEGISQKLSKMREHIQQLPQNTFIPVKEASFVFSTNPVARLLVEDVNRLKLGLAFQDKPYFPAAYVAGTEVDGMGGLRWGLCSVDQARQLYKTLHWRIDLTKIKNKYIGDKKNLTGLTLHEEGTFYHFEDDKVANLSGWYGVVVADLYVSPIPREENSLSYILSEGFTPEEGQDPDFWPALVLLLSGNLVKLKSNEEKTGYDLEYNEEEVSIELLKDLADGMENGGLLKSYFNILGGDEIKKVVEETFQKRPIPFAELFEDVLERDQMRCDLPVYEMQLLTSPNRGSWDLWETERPDHKGEKRCKGKKSFYARDPRQDISQFGIIGIDFGTKSTVVTCLEDTNQIIPLRIGTGEWDREAIETDYENPTVMEFTNIDEFLKAYKAGAGKPDTRWTDLDISHTAAQNWKDNGDSDNCAAFLVGLKQWAGTASYPR